MDKKIGMAVIVMLLNICLVAEEKKPPETAEEVIAQIKALIKDLSSIDQSTRQAAFQELLEIGSVAEEHLEDFLQTSSTHSEVEISPEAISAAKELLARMSLRTIGLDPAITELKKKLSTINHDFLLRGTSLVDHTAHLSQLYDIPFYYEPSARQLAQEKKTISLRGLPLKLALKHLFSQYGLSYTFRQKAIWLTKTGTLIKELKFLPSQKVSELDQRVYDLLQRKIELPFQRPAPLSEVLDFLRTYIPEFNILIHREVDLNKNLFTIVNNCPLGDVLAEMLRGHNLGYVVKDGVLLVTSYQKILSGLLVKLEQVTQRKIEPPPHLQIRYEIAGWTVDKPDEVLILTGAGQAQFSLLEKDETLKECYRVKNFKEDFVRLLKTLLDNYFFAPPLMEIAVSEEVPLATIKFSLDTYEYQLWFPVSTELLVSAEEKDLNNLQVIEKEFRRIINRLKKEGLRVKP